MKPLTTILIAFLVLGCFSQESDLNSYSVPLNKIMLDSVKAYTIDSVNAMRYINPDTFDIKIDDGRIVIYLKKEGHNVWYDLMDDHKRINADYYDYTRRIMLMDSGYTVGSLYIR